VRQSPGGFVATVEIVPGEFFLVREVVCVDGGQKRFAVDVLTVKDSKVSVRMIESRITGQEGSAVHANASACAAATAFGSLSWLHATMGVLPLPGRRNAPVPRFSPGQVGRYDVVGLPAP
jgi:hypothetical protein